MHVIGSVNALGLCSNSASHWKVSFSGLENSSFKSAQGRLLHVVGEPSVGRQYLRISYLLKGMFKNMIIAYIKRGSM